MAARAELRTQRHVASRTIKSHAAHMQTSTAPMPAKRTRTRKGEVDARWLYNNFRIGVVLVDVRRVDLYRLNSVIGAVSIPPSQNARQLSDLEIRSSAGVDITAFPLPPHKRSLKDIVLIGDAYQCSDKRSWLYKLQRFFVADGLVASVQVLQDGFKVFEDRYPFYTTQFEASSNDASFLEKQGSLRVTYPNEVLEGFLYLGNMWQAQCRSVITDLGITHIVNASLDADNVFQDVLYHNVCIKDEPSAQIHDKFDGAFDFIESARLANLSTSVPDRDSNIVIDQTRPCRVLVHCTHGISRSATLVIMYLLRAHRSPLIQAYNHVLQSRGVIYPNPGFLRTLQEEEQRVLGQRKPLNDQSLDLLAQGQIKSCRPLDARPTTGTNEYATSRCAIM